MPAADGLLDLSRTAPPRLPMHFSPRSSSRQIGNGVPQKRERERFQSFRFSSQLPKRPVPVLSGCQLMVLLSSTMRSLRAVSLDKPAIQWIIEDRLVRTPAVRIVVHVLLALESLALLLQSRSRVRYSGLQPSQKPSCPRHHPH